jgi:hypothetical protein
MKDDDQCSLPIFAPQWVEQAFWMPFSSQCLHAATFNDVLIYRIDVFG